MNRIKYDIENSFGSIVRRADIALINRLNQNFRNAGYDITTEQYRVLVNLWNKDGQNQQELAEGMGKNKASITRLINGLEKRNLAVRVPNSLDNRNKFIYLTNKGKQIPEALANLAKQTLSEALVGISEKKIEMCKDILCEVFDNLYPLSVNDGTEVK
jgi:DNA-binding MarR family transcriptional regulator